MKLYKDKEILILNVAWDLFTEKGFHDTKISEIAKKAGIGKGTVYEYFISKEELVQEMIVYYVSESHRKLSAELEKIENPEEKLVYMARNDIEKGMDLFKTIKVLQMISDFDKCSVKDSVMMIMAERLKLIHKVVQEGMDHGDFAPKNVALTELMYTGMINNAMIMQHTAGEVSFDTEELIQFILEKMK